MNDLRSSKQDEQMEEMLEELESKIGRAHV